MSFRPSKAVLKRGSWIAALAGLACAGVVTAQPVIAPPAPPMSATMFTALVSMTCAVSSATVEVKLVIASVNAAASAACVAKYSNMPAPSAGTV